MAKLNWNRPNNGYEREPWAKSYGSVAEPKMDPLPVREHKSQHHQIKIVKATSGPHYGSYKCLTCNNKWLAWASKK